MDLGRRAPRRVHVAVRSLRAPSRSASVLPAWPSFGSAVHGHPSGTPFWFELSSMSVRLTPRFPPERVRGTHTTATMLPDSVAATNPGLGVSPAARGPGFARSRAANNAAQLRRASTATNRRGGAVPALRARIPDAVRHRPHAFGTAGRWRRGRALIFGGGGPPAPPTPPRFSCRGGAVPVLASGARRRPPARQRPVRAQLGRVLPRLLRWRRNIALAHSSTLRGIAGERAGRR
jgi:hypothetical protein